LRREKPKRPAWARPSPKRLVLVGLATVALSIQLEPSLWAQTADLVDRSALRVCADPANLPFSSTNRDGFEDRLAALLGDALGVPVTYTWFPQATGFIRNTLRANKCDIVMGYVQGHELVQNTNHYYRSAYVLLYRSDSELQGVDNLDDPRLIGKRIGVVAGTPPATILALNGMIGDAKSFHLHVDRRYSSPGEDMVDEIASGELDAGILWGPIGGYYAKLIEVPITVVPLVKESKGPRMSFRITMGVRHNEPDWKHQLNEFIATNQDEINAILLDYGVPLLDEQDHLITQ